MYTALGNDKKVFGAEHKKADLKSAVNAFLGESCEDLRFSREKSAGEDREKGVFLGTSLRKRQIPYNMQMDIDRLCLAHAAGRFLDSKTAQDAFDVYLCYLEMFVGAGERSRRIIELLSESEAASGPRLMKDQNCFVHAACIFLLGLAAYETNTIYRQAYRDFYQKEEYGKDFGEARGQDKKMAHHYLQYWGLASLFHGMGYPFERPFEFKKLLEELGCGITASSVDALEAVAMHHSLCKNSPALFKDETDKSPLELNQHPLAYMLMLCNKQRCRNGTDERDGKNKETILSGSSFIHLYNFAAALNGRWKIADEWGKADAGKREALLNEKRKDFEEAFAELSLEYKLFNICQVKSFGKYLDRIGCFYADRPVDYEILDAFSAEDMAKIGPMEHGSWLREHYDMGWKYTADENISKDRRELLRVHCDMVPHELMGDGQVITDEIVMKNYDRLNKREQDKDIEPMNAMLLLLRMYDGLRIYKLEKKGEEGLYR